MEAQDLVTAVRDRGGEFTVNGVKMEVRPKGVLTDEEREYISAHKPEVLSAITGKPVEDYIESEIFEVNRHPGRALRRRCGSPESKLTRCRSPRSGTGRIASCVDTAIRSTRACSKCWRLWAT